VEPLARLADVCFVLFFSSRRRHTRFSRDWSSDVCSSDLTALMRSVTSPRPGAGGGATSTVSSLRSSMSCNARILRVEPLYSSLSMIFSESRFRLFEIMLQANLAARLDAFPRQDKAGVLPAKAEEIGENRRHVGRALDVRHHVELDRGVGIVVVDGRRQNAFAHGHQREGGLHRPRR